MATDRNGCAGNRCPSFHDCAFYRARQRIRDAEVVVANHDMVLSALEIPPGSVLPDPSDCFFVFDEGHALPHKIVQHYAERHPIRATYGWASEVPEVVQTVVHALRIDASIHSRVQAACADVMGALGLLWQWVAQAEGWKDGVLRFVHGVVPDELALPGESLLEAVEVVLDVLGEARVEALNCAADSPDLDIMVARLAGERARLQYRGLHTGVCRATCGWTGQPRH